MGKNPREGQIKSLDAAGVGELSFVLGIPRRVDRCALERKEYITRQRMKQNENEKKDDGFVYI